MNTVEPHDEPAPAPRPLRPVPPPRAGESGPPVAPERAPREEPRVAIPPRARAYQGRRAGLVSRSAAALIDAVVVVVLLTGAYLGIVAVQFLLSPHTFSFPDLAAVFALAGFLGMLTVYLTASWATTGRTYGDHVMGLRVVNFRGRRLNWGGAFVRAVACAFFPVGLLWVAVSRENRSFQDVVLRTSVVYDWREAAEAVPS